MTPIEFMEQAFELESRKFAIWMEEEVEWLTRKLIEDGCPDEVFARWWAEQIVYGAIQ